MARPRKEIDKGNFEKLCALQCSKGEIAGFFDVSEDTIDRFCKREYKESFAVVLDKKSAQGKISLRRAQFKLAEKSASMAIFLGKNYLGQTDAIEQNVSVISDEMREQVQMMLDGIDKKASDRNIEDNTV